MNISKKLIVPATLAVVGVTGFGLNTLNTATAQAATDNSTTAVTTTAAANTDPSASAATDTTSTASTDGTSSSTGMTDSSMPGRHCDHTDQSSQTSTS